MISSIYRIAEQCLVTLPNVERQVLIAAVQDCLGSVVKLQWYENRQDGVAEVDGVFIYAFGKTTPLTPVLDTAAGFYYITMPASYVRIPCELGINQVSFLRDQANDFVRLNSGSVSMWSNLKAFALGGKQTYFIEGAKMYFPKMAVGTVDDILLKLAVAYAQLDVREEFTVPPDVINQVVIMVNQRFMGPPADKKQ